ncbi:MAG: UDP-N-acetylmuramate--L-alanine ligase [Erysipelotrichaceae bacterium]|nr:UDP-N-acetylmuramate--L-alanine ligase [Erysipelotrichaceae bacterium]
MYYFIGIKGTGMASLAVMLHDLGNDVCGSDQQKHFFTEDELVKRNITILPFDENNIKPEYTVIIGNAFLEDFPEVIRARKLCKCYRYHEFLGELMKDYKTISICGSHGKTTTTTIAKSVVSKFKKTGYLIGDGEGFLSKDSEYLCVESDEFRRHFISYYPEYAIITNIEIDHVDYFKDEIDYFNAYQEFVTHVKNAVFYYGDDEWCQKLEFSCPAYSFGFDRKNDYYPENLETGSDYSAFDFMYKGEKLYRYELPFVGDHLLIDVMGVLALSHQLGFDYKQTEEALLEYHGPKRRYVVEEYKDTIFVDDYAHHPTEVKVTLKASRQRYPDRKIIAIFKPHRASRVMYFAKQFKDALLEADEIYLLDFTSIDDKQDGTDIDITYLANMIENSHILSEDEEGAKELAKYKGECLVFMSSKDIYNIADMVKELL